MVTGNGYVGCDSDGGGTPEMNVSIYPVIIAYEEIFFSCRNIMSRAKSKILVCCAEILMKILITSIGETLFKTRSDQEEGMIGQASLLHS